MSGREEIVDELMKLLEGFNAKKVALTPDTDIPAQLELDSVQVMDFIMQVEDTFDINIPQHEVAEIRTLNDLADVVVKRKGA